MNLGELEDGASAEDKNKEEENAEEVQAALVECCVTLGRADKKLVEFGTEEENSLPCKRQFKCADDLMDHIK